MLSVKLKLFEIMDTKDKLVLLFLVGELDHSRDTSAAYFLRPLPTFATPTLVYFPSVDHYGLDNFDWSNKFTISMHLRVHDSQLDYYLQLTPKKYRVLSKPHSEETLALTILQKEILCSHFQLNEHSLEIDVIQIPPSTFDREGLYLTGSFLENIWLLRHSCMPDDNVWDHYGNDDTVTVFNIY
ncbi:hypothetical protein BCR42DRAFT_426068 [Absidia repens]|uniref:Uncharacterized protein n=1 Tax=Absidia repens TaxID=90262 RepID=A0A1X2I1J0_9FUNG|nr:hypothetical protein BCR42DRAFT_426068 [Absidia repens]